MKWGRQAGEFPGEARAPGAAGEKQERLRGGQGTPVPRAEWGVRAGGGVEGEEPFGVSLKWAVSLSREQQTPAPPSPRRGRTRAPTGWAEWPLEDSRRLSALQKGWGAEGHAEKGRGAAWPARPGASTVQLGGSVAWSSRNQPTEACLGAAGPAQAVECVTPDLGVMSSSPTLGLGFT